MYRIQPEREAAAQACAIEPIQPGLQLAGDIVGQAVIDLAAGREIPEGLFLGIGVAVIFHHQRQTIERGMPHRAAEQADLVAVKESLEVGLAGLPEKGLAIVEGGKGQRYRIAQQTGLGAAAPAHSQAGVDIAEALGDDDIFAAIDAGADNIVDSHREGRQQVTLVPQPGLHTKSAIVIDRIARLKML